MGRLKNISLSLLFILIAYPIAAQTVIKGTVIDAETGKPLPNTNVYLANTTIGTSTDSTGYYKMELRFSGVYNLVFSFIGYKEKIIPIEITTSSSIIIGAELKPEAIQLGKLSVSGSNKIWRERFARFRDEFIGTTDFAKKTTILNPEVLRFEVDQKTDQLLASSIKPIIVINNSLGYKIYLELDQFKWSLHGIKGLYLIYPKFEPIITDNQQLQEKWRENRRETYEGSFNHFLRSLYHENLTVNDFTVTREWSIESLSDSETYFQLLGKVNLAELNELKLKGFKIFNPVLVEYRKSFDTLESFVGSNTSEQTFFINQLGNLLRPLTLRTTGYWSRMRLANTLPDNYVIND